LRRGRDDGEKAGRVEARAASESVCAADALNDIEPGEDVIVVGRKDECSGWKGQPAGEPSDDWKAGWPCLDESD